MIQIYFLREYDTFSKGQIARVEITRARNLIRSGIAVEYELAYNMRGHAI